MSNEIWVKKGTGEQVRGELFFTKDLRTNTEIVFAIHNGVQVEIELIAESELKKRKTTWVIHGTDLILHLPQDLHNQLLSTSGPYRLSLNNQQLMIEYISKNELNNRRSSWVFKGTNQILDTVDLNSIVNWVFCPTTNNFLMAEMSNHFDGVIKLTRKLQIHLISQKEQWVYYGTGKPVHPNNNNAILERIVYHEKQLLEYKFVSKNGIIAHAELIDSELFRRRNFTWVTTNSGKLRNHELQTPINFKNIQNPIFDAKTNELTGGEYHLSPTQKGSIRRVFKNDWFRLTSFINFVRSTFNTENKFRNAYYKDQLKEVLKNQKVSVDEQIEFIYANIKNMPLKKVETVRSSGMSLTPVSATSSVKKTTASLVRFNNELQFFSSKKSTKKLATGKSLDGADKVWVVYGTDLIIPKQWRGTPLPMNINKLAVYTSPNHVTLMGENISTKVLNERRSTWVMQATGEVFTHTVDINSIVNWHFCPQTGHFQMAELPNLFGRFFKLGRMLKTVVDQKKDLLVHYGQGMLAEIPSKTVIRGSGIYSGKKLMEVEYTTYDKKILRVELIDELMYKRRNFTWVTTSNSEFADHEIVFPIDLQRLENPVFDNATNEVIGGVYPLTPMKNVTIQRVFRQDWLDIHACKSYNVFLKFELFYENSFVRGEIPYDPDDEVKMINTRKQPLSSLKEKNATKRQRPASAPTQTPTEVIPLMPIARFNSQPSFFKNLPTAEQVSSEESYLNDTDSATPTIFTSVSPSMYTDPFALPELDLGDLNLDDLNEASDDMNIFI